MSGNQNLVQTLCNVLASIRQQWVQLQIMGRALTPEEEERMQELARSTESLSSLVELLGGECPIGEPDTPRPEPERNILLDGRYEGGNREISLELRIDEGGSGVISADLYRNGLTGRTYAASLRTAPGTRVRRNQGRWSIICSGWGTPSVDGTLTLEAKSPDGSSLTGAVRLDAALNGLPVRNDIHFAADYVSSRMRRLGIEIEREQNLPDLPSDTFEGREVSVASSLEAAGFDVGNIGEHSTIPAPTTEWGTGAALHALMADFAEARLDRPAWELHLLLLSRSSRDGLFGVMFDSTESLPRQGAAVFAEEIRNYATTQHFPRKLIQTTVHELGHALNLAHRFERVVGRVDSTSFMNYDWRYGGGNRVGEYWSKFRYAFDSDELEFLRHGPRYALIPGGAAFHSVNYWADGNGGYSPYVPEIPVSFLQLTLRSPASGPLFAFAQPVFLEIELKNLSNNRFTYTPEILDPKSGLLEVLISRVGETGPADVYQPVAERCFDLSADRMAVLAPGGSINNNLNLTFGSGGFPFAEPGVYDVKALLVFFDRVNEREFIVASNVTRIRIAYPHSREEENDALVLLRDDVGLYFSFGGSQRLSDAHDALEDVRKRRQGRAKTITDPVVANIVRCNGIDAGRSYQRYSEGKFKPLDGDSGAAADLLEALSASVLSKTFDAHTAKHTEMLMKKFRKAAPK